MDSKYLRERYIYSKEDLNGAKNGNKVVVEIVEWPESK